MSACYQSISNMFYNSIWFQIYSNFNQFNIIWYQIVPLELSNRPLCYGWGDSFQFQMNNMQAHVRSLKIEKKGFKLKSVIFVSELHVINACISLPVVYQQHF